MLHSQRMKEHMTSKKVKPTKSIEEFLDDLIRDVRLNPQMSTSEYNYLLANLKDFVENYTKSHQLFPRKDCIV
jgi:hypothetical protein